MLLWVGRIRIALMTLMRSTPLRSAKRLHSLRKARIVARYEFSTIFVVSDSIGRSMTVSGKSFVLRTSRRNFSTRLRASALQPEQTRQKSRMLRTYSRARHDALEAVGEQRRRLDAALGEGALENRPRDELGRARRDRRLDEDEAFRPDLLADRAHRRLERRHVGLARAHVAEIVLEVVALDVDDDAVGELQDVAREGRDERLLLLHGALDDLVHLGVLGLDGRDAAVEDGDLPVAPRARPLAADDELARPPFLSTVSAMIAAITAPTNPTPMTTTISLPSARARFASVSTRLSSAAYSSLSRKGEFLAVRAYRELLRRLESDRLCAEP